MNVTEITMTWEPKPPLIMFHSASSFLPSFQKLSEAYKWPLIQDISLICVTGEEE